MMSNGDSGVFNSAGKLANTNLSVVMFSVLFACATNAKGEIC